MYLARTAVADSDAYSNQRIVAVAIRLDTPDCNGHTSPRQRIQGKCSRETAENYYADNEDRELIHAGHGEQLFR